MASAPQVKRDPGRPPAAPQVKRDLAHERAPPKKTKEAYAQAARQRRMSKETYYTSKEAYKRGLYGIPHAAYRIPYAGTLSCESARIECGYADTRLKSPGCRTIALETA